MFCRALMALVSATFAACATAPATSPASEAAGEPAVIPGLEQVAPGWHAEVAAWHGSAPEFAELVRVATFMALPDQLIIIFERRVGEGTACRSGLTRVTFGHDGDGWLEAERYDAGLDCCPGQACVPGPDGWQLRWNRAVDAGARAALAELVAPGGFELHVTYPGPAEEGDGALLGLWTASDLREGDVEVPGCGLVWGTPSCGEADPRTGAFVCRCDAGGSHTVFSWVGGPDGPRVAHIRVAHTPDEHH
jgi:hypothetical protein